MDVSTAGSLTLLAYQNALQNSTPIQALQQGVAQSSLLASSSGASLVGEVGSADSYTNILRLAGEASMYAASYTLGAQSGNGASEIESRLASAQSNSSVSGLLASTGVSSLAGLDPRTAGALTAFQVRSAPSAADAYAQVQAIAANANKAISGMTMSLMA
jgi:hypothetical protein